MGIISGLKKIGNFAATKTKNTAEKIRINNQIHDLKLGILRSFDYGRIQRFARTKNIGDIFREKKFSHYKNDYFYDPLTGYKTKRQIPIYKEHSRRRTFDEYVSILDSKTNIEEVLEFAELVNLPGIYNLRSKYNELISKKENIGKTEFVEEIKEKNKNFFEIVNEIKSFKPLMKYQYELPYQAELGGFLKRTYPQTIVEQQKGSSRPDIVINDIAIEVKGPTSSRDLETIASKLVRYRQHFSGGTIVVMFDVQCMERYYNETINGLKEQHPEVEFIRK